MGTVRKFDVPASLFEPIDLDVNGTIFRVKPTTLKTLKVIQQLWADMAAGSGEAISAGLKAVFEGNTDILEELPINQLKDVLEFALQESMRPGEDDGKNLPGPGDKP